MAEATIDSKVTVEDAGPSRKKITIEIPASAVTEKLADSLDLIAVEAALPGFRKGRAPRRLVEKRFGGAVKDEAKQQLVASAYQSAIDDNKLKVIGEPFSEELEALELEEGKGLSFSLEVEVVPEFEVPELDGLKVRKPLPEVTDEMVQDEIDKVLINEGELEERDASEPGDYLTGHGIMTTDDGEEIHNIEGAVVQIPAADKDGKGMILGVMIDDLAKQLGSPKAGDTITIKTTGPEQHEVENLRGKPLTITFKVDRIDRIIPAELGDVVARFGLASEEQMREMVRSRLNERSLVQQQTVMRQQVAKHLLDNVEIELPERLSAAQAQRLLERRRMELMYRGVDQMQIEEHIAELRAATAEAAQKELKLFFILSKVGDEMDVKVEEAEINGRIAQMAMERGERPEKLRQELIESRQVQQIYQQLREHKTLDAILSKAEFEEMSPEEFNEAMKAEAEA